MPCPECNGLGVVFYTRPSWLEGAGAFHDLGDEVFDTACPECSASAQKDDRAGVEPDAA